MDANNAIHIAPDPAQNILRLSFVGDIGTDEMRDAEKEIAAAIAAMRRGFYLLTDLSELKKMDVHCMPHITKAMELSRNQGIARVVRIIPDRSKDIGLNIMALFHYPRGLKIITCANGAEADSALQ